MGERLTGEDFEHLLRYYRFTAFRLEVQPVYLVEGEQEAVREFVAGQPRPGPDIPYLAEWYAQIRQVTAEGRRIARVRIVDEPPTDYQRWEAWIGQWNSDAGEDIRYLSRPRAIEVGLPLDYDWWLFDSLRLARMRFDAKGRPLGGDIITDPETVLQHCAWRDLAVHCSAPQFGALTT